MPTPEPSVFDEIDPHGGDRAMERGEADHAAGRTIGNEAMKDWLRSWGTAEMLPRPKCGE